MDRNIVLDVCCPCRQHNSQGQIKKSGLKSILLLSGYLTKNSSTFKNCVTCVRFSFHFIWILHPVNGTRKQLVPSFKELGFKGTFSFKLKANSEVMDARSRKKSVLISFQNKKIAQN